MKRKANKITQRTQKVKKNTEEELEFKEEEKKRSKSKENEIEIQVCTTTNSKKSKVSTLTKSGSKSSRSFTNIADITDLSSIKKNLNKEKKVNSKGKLKSIVSEKDEDEEEISDNVNKIKDDDIHEEATEENQNDDFNNQLKNILQGLSQTSKGDKNKTSKNSSISNKLSGFVHFDKFPYDNSIHKQIDIEITIQKKNKSTSIISKEELNEITTRLVESLNDFFKRKPFVYYEFSNPRGKADYIHSSIDFLNYDYLYERNNLSLSTNQIANANRTSSVVKDINYVSAMSSVYKKFIRGEILNDNYEDYNKFRADNFFYLVTPLVSFYFFKFEMNEFFISTIGELTDSGTLISNYNKFMEKNLKESGIKYEKIPIRKNDGSAKSKSKTKINKNSNSINLLSINNNSSEVEVMSNFINSEVVSDSLIYVKNYYNTILFNMLLNQYEDSSMNIFSPYSFDSSSFHQCKYQIEPFIKVDQETITINVKIFGCIFDLFLQQIITFISYSGEDEEEKTILFKDCLDKSFKHCYSIKFYPFMKTSNFYTINKKLKGVVEKVEFKNNMFNVKMQN